MLPKCGTFIVDAFEVIKVKAEAGTSSGMPKASSSRAIVRGNRQNGSENPPNFSPVYAELKQQGERTDKVLDLLKNQAKSMESQVSALATQGEVLKKHSSVMGQILKDHQKLREDVGQVEKKVQGQDSTLKQHDARLKKIEGRIDNLWKGHHGNGNHRAKSKLRRSNRLQPSRIQQVPASGCKVKYYPKDCKFCHKTYSSSYIYQHKKYCPVIRQQGK